MVTPRRIGYLTESSAHVELRSAWAGADRDYVYVCLLSVEMCDGVADPSFSCVGRVKCPSFNKLERFVEATYCTQADCKLRSLVGHRCYVALH